MGLAFVSAPAHACRVHRAVQPADVQYADVVVVGRIANYHLALDPKLQEKLREKLGNSPDMAPDVRKLLEKQLLTTDHARFDILIDRILAGQPPSTLTVTWSNSTFGEPATMPAGPFVIALYDPAARPDRISGALSGLKDGSLTVLQAPCSGAFIFPVESEEAAAVRAILQR
jgi:predicted LPLAT superfamily acyltransferase